MMTHKIKRYFYACLTACVFAFFASPAKGEMGDRPLFSPNRGLSPIYQYEYVKAGSGEHHASVSYSIDRDDADPDRFLLKIRGEGDYDDFEDIAWEMTAIVRNVKGVARPMETEIKVFDDDGTLESHIRKVFNYDTGEAEFQRMRKGDVLRSRAYPIKGPTCDDVTLMVFLKSVMPQILDGSFRDFYMVSSEPHLYHVLIKDHGTAVIETVIGEVEARKIQVVADVGPLTDLMNRLVKPTYLYFSREAPYDVLAYEGYDANRFSEYIRGTITAPVDVIQIYLK